MANRNPNRPGIARAKRTVKTAEPRQYHHGDLRRSLLDAAVHLIESEGLDALSMREVAKLVGVSPAAPFRHFASRTALLTAVAEEAMDRLSAAVQQALHSLGSQEEVNPLVQFRAIGVAFLEWAFVYPTHFQVISNRAVIDFEGSTLRARNDAIRQRMLDLIANASRRGLLRPGSPERHMLAARALAYGLGRMYIDGQFPSWGVSEQEALAESIAMLDQYLASITK